MCKGIAVKQQCLYTPLGECNMKRLIRFNTRTNDILDLDIDVNLIPEGTRSIAATEIKPVFIDKDKQIVDDLALANFSAFVDNVFEILDYYDFVVNEEYKRTSKSFPHTAHYAWVARREQVNAGDVPKYIHLRIADHLQHETPQFSSRMKEKQRQEADAIKLPKTKKKQRYTVENIVINNEVCNTYEEALRIVEKIIFKWMKDQQIDVSQYDQLGF